MIIEAVALYWPMALCGVLYSLLQGKIRNDGSGVELKRVMAAGMMAGAWVAATLPWLNDWCVAVGFWSFEVEHGYRLRSLPLSLYVGWILLWGVLPAFLIGIRWPGGEIWKIIMILVLLDLLTMGVFEPVMVLTPVEWLWGELLIVTLGLLPAICMAKWVIFRERVNARSGLISVAFVILLLVVLPTSVKAIRIDLAACWNSYSLVNKCLWGILLMVVSVPGIAGIVEFSKVGNGTPIPYDAPEKLVTSGVYSYVQNPMQWSMFMVLLVWSLIFGSWFVAGLAVASVIYSVGLARWSEGLDLEQRFGKIWIDYDSSISPWKFSFKPVWGVKERARIYIDGDCKVCRPIADWVEKRELTSLVVCEAGDWRDGQRGGVERLERITYLDPNTGVRREGMEAMCSVFQHVHLGWAWLGWVLMLPGVCWIIQRGIDAGGGGKQMKV